MSYIEKGRRLVNKKFFELWNEEYRDGIKTRGDKIGMTLCIIKPLNDVRRGSSLQTTMPTGNTSPIVPPSSIIVVWLCGKIRQLNTCTNMYIHSLFSVCACRMCM